MHTEHNLKRGLRLAAVYLLLALPASLHAQPTNAPVTPAPAPAPPPVEFAPGPPPAAVPAAAPLAAPAGADDDLELPKQSILEAIEKGGWMMYVLGVMSLVGLAFVLYFMIVLRHRNFTPPGLVRDVKRLVTEGRIPDAMELCRRNRSPSAAIAYAALSYVDRVEFPDPAMLSEIVESEGARQSTAVQNQTAYLLDIGVIAPMCGLLGTVMGMLKTFSVIALDIAKARPMLLAEGVAQALVTTAAGLLVAIPAMVAYAYFRGRAASLLATLEIEAMELLTLLQTRTK